MKNARIKTSIVLLVLIMTAVIPSVALAACASDSQNNETVTVTDMLGETVEVKKNPQKVACASRTTYDLLIAFGLGDCIDGVYYSLLDNEWAQVFDKDASDRYSLEYEESYETYIARGVDLVFAPEKYIADGLKEHGITALNVSLYGNPSFGPYVYFFAELVKQLWDSEEVAARVDEWIAVMQDTIEGIENVLEEKDEEKRTLYYVRGDKNKGVGYTDNGQSFTEYAYGVLGMDFIGNRFETNTPSAEEICAQNPDVIVVGGIYQKTLIEELQKEPYVHLDAVRNGKVYNIPVGLTVFEQLSVFSPAFLCDQANKLYPQYFDYDVTAMVKDLGKRFFGAELTDAEVQNMLDGLSREGNPLA